MGVIVRFTDPMAARLRKRAQRLGFSVLAAKGGVKVEIMDGFIARAIGDTKTVVVTLIGLEMSVSAFGWQASFFGGSAPTQWVYESRYVGMDVRRVVGELISGEAVALSALTGPDSPVRAHVSGVTLTLAGTPPIDGIGVTRGRRHLSKYAVTNATVPSAGGNVRIRRSVAGHKWVYGAPSSSLLIPHRPANTPGGTSSGELACIIFMTSELAPTAERLYTGAAVAEISSKSGLLIVQPLRIVDDAYTPMPARLVRYEVDYKGSSVSIAWNVPITAPAGSFDTQDFTGLPRTATAHVLSATATEAIIAISLHVGDYRAAPTLDLMKADVVTGGITSRSVSLGNRRWCHPWSVSVGGRPYIVVPTLAGVIVTDSGPDHYSFSQAVAANLGALLVTPNLDVVPITTPGYFVQSCSVSHMRSAGGYECGALSGGASGTYRKWYAHEDEFAVGAESADARGCEYAPGLLAVVLIPNEDFLEQWLHRYLGVISIDTGALIYVSPAPLSPPADIWTPVNLSVIEIGTVNAAGDIATHASLLVSSYSVNIGDPYIPFNSAAINAWVTADGGVTLAPLYPAGMLPSEIVRLPVSNATYMGNSLLPARLGSTRGGG